MTVTPNLMPPPEGGYSNLPRLSIVHRDGKLEFNDEQLSYTQQSNLIMLGLVRQRTMFAKNAFGAGAIECRSYDFEHGNPTAIFPWDEPINNWQRDAPLPLACGACAFADWTPNPLTKRGSDPARCYEQMVVPTLVPSDDHLTRYSLGTITFQKSALKPIYEYMKQIRDAGRPAYARTTRMNLNVNLGSDFKYSVPRFTAEAEVAPESYPTLSLILRAARDTISTPRPTQPKRSGGMLSVDITPPSDSGYTGSFFS